MTDRTTIRRPLTRAEFLRFNPRWNEQDLATIREHLGAAATCEEVDPPGYNHYVEVCDAEGRVLMHVSKGTIYRDGNINRLSTTSGGGGGCRAKPEPALPPLCSACYLHHPEGECDR